MPGASTAGAFIVRSLSCARHSAKPSDLLFIHLAVPRNQPRRSRRRGERPARSAPPLPPAASQLSPRIWLAPSARLRIWSQSAPRRCGRRGPPGHLRPGRAQPRRAPRPPARGVRSLRPFPPARCPGRDSAADRRARPGGGQREAAGPRRRPARLSTCLSVRVARCPPAEDR